MRIHSFWHGIQKIMESRVEIVVAILRRSYVYVYTHAKREKHIAHTHIKQKEKRKKKKEGRKKEERKDKAHFLTRSRNLEDLPLNENFSFVLIASSERFSLSRSLLKNISSRR